MASAQHTRFMKRSCSFKLCSGNDLNSSLFTFPNVHTVQSGVKVLNLFQVERCRKWLENVGNESLKSLGLAELSGKYFVCRRHFDDDQFSPKSCKVLKRSAVPTIFNQMSENGANPIELNVCNNAHSNINDNSAQILRSMHQKVKRKCCVKFCDGNNAKSSMHMFPNTKTCVNGVTVLNETQVERCKLWLEAIGNCDLLAYDYEKLHKYFFVCGNHFDDNQFRPTTCSTEHRRLKSTAVPSIFRNSRRNDETTSEGHVQSASEVGHHDTDTFTRSNAQIRNLAISKTCVKRKCCAPECTSTNLTSKLHAFPPIISVASGEPVVTEDGVERLKIWVRNTGNTKLTVVHPSHLSTRFHVCSAHFDPNAFTTQGSLKKTAVPTIFCSSPLSGSKFQQYQENITKLIGTHQANLENDEFSATNSLFNSLKFEEQMKSLRWNCCKNCKEKHLNTTTVKCSHGKNCGDFTKANDMDPGEVPEELQDLSFVEEQLICRIHPLISIFKLKGLQFGYTENVISFPQSVESFADQLPRRVNELPSILTVRFANEKVEAQDFLVRGPKVYHALLWLKEHNPFYEHINISMDNLNSLPVHGDVFHKIQSVILSESDCDRVDKSRDGNCSASKDANSDNSAVNTEEGVDSPVYHSSVFHANSSNQNSQIKTFLDWPAMDSTPVNEFKTAGYVACAFPTLFPNGTGDLRSHRLKTVKPANYFKHLMNFHDGRFAKHATFRYFALNSIMRWNALSNGNIFVKKNEVFDNITVEELKERFKTDPGSIKKIMLYASNLRGTAAYRNMTSFIVDPLSMEEDRSVKQVVGTDSLDEKSCTTQKVTIKEEPRIEDDLSDYDDDTLMPCQPFEEVIIRPKAEALDVFDSDGENHLDTDLNMDDKSSIKTRQFSEKSVEVAMEQEPLADKEDEAVDGKWAAEEQQPVVVETAVAKETTEEEMLFLSGPFKFEYPANDIECGDGRQAEIKVEQLCETEEDTHKEGNQCLATSLAFICFASVHDPSLWNQSDIDNCLIAGNKLYATSVKQLKSGNTLGHPHLHPSELVKYVYRYQHCRKIFFNVETKDEIRGALDQRCSDPLLQSYEISRGLCKLFSDYNTGVLTTNNASLGIFKLGDLLWFFDSHQSCNRSLNFDGKAALTQFSGVQCLANHVRKLYNGSGSFVVTPISDILADFRKNELPVPVRKRDHRRKKCVSTSDGYKPLKRGEVKTGQWLTEIRRINKERKFAPLKNYIEERRRMKAGHSSCSAVTDSNDEAMKAGHTSWSAVTDSNAEAMKAGHTSCSAVTDSNAEAIKACHSSCSTVTDSNAKVMKACHSSCSTVIDSNAGEDLESNKETVLNGSILGGNNLKQFNESPEADSGPRPKRRRARKDYRIFYTKGDEITYQQYINHKRRERFLDGQFGDE